MPARESSASRQRLLEAALDHLAERGVSGMSLRGLAAGIGTSHRMLLYHFGSREGLLVAVVQEMERRQRALLTRLARDPATSSGETASPGDTARAYWRQLRDPALRSYVRLFFEMYGQAVQGVPGTVELLDGLVEPWVDALTGWGIWSGLSPERARAYARLGIATPRGLLLDLLATGDEGAVDAAMEEFIALYERLWPVP